MNRAVFGGLLATALAAGLAFRFVAIDARPVHHDEANQAVKFGALVEHGEYQYDPTDHHGPTLYYLTLPFAWARGQFTPASLDERTLRTVPALFGAGLILLFGLLSAGLGRGAVAASAFVVALSPAFTYFSRFYIQESLLAFFVVAFVIALGRFTSRPSRGASIGAGLIAGLAIATKETAVIAIASALAAAALAHRFRTAETDGERPAAPRGRGLAMVAAGVAAAVFIAFVFYSSWFSRPSGLFEAIGAFSLYVDRGVSAGPHVQPWDYYLRLLAYSSSGGVTWSEGVVLVLACVGLATAFRARAGFWPRYVAFYAVIATAVFSAIPYKTPWNLLPFYAGLALVAGLGARALWDISRAPAVRAVVALLFLAGATHLGFQNVQANVRYPADPRNPYVYAQTVPDFLRLVGRVQDLSAVHADGSGMPVTVVAGPYEQWPLPWYLRRMTRVGYWTAASDARPLDRAPVVIASAENADAVAATLGERYVSEFYGLRPEVVLTVYIERTLWEKFLASRAGAPGK